MEKANVIVESFNKAIENHFSEFEKKYMKLQKKSVNENEFFEYMNQSFDSLEESINIWGASAIDELDGKSPEQFINSVSDLDEIMELFRLFAIGMDEANIPQILVSKLGEFGEKAIASLSEVISADSLENKSEDEIQVLITAVEVIGILKGEAAIDELISLLYKCDDEDDRVMEAISSSLIKIGVPAVETLLKKVKALSDISVKEEFILETLSEIGSENKNEEIYKVLKDAFRKMDNKMLAADNLAKYGDGRAIPALRGYIEKNIDTIDRETFYEIAYAIEQLGGDISDIDVHFDEDDLDDEEFNEE